MLGAVFRGPGRLEVGEMETPEIGPDEVLVKVGANTVCGTDVRILRGEKTRGIGRDVVLGHELAGHVAEAGRNVRGYEVGAPVALAPAISCLRCFYCRRGMENVCVNKRIVGNVVDGGLAEYVRVPAEAVQAGNLFVAERDLPSEYLALAEPLACCVRGLENYRVELDDVVLVMGAGPIGLFHLQLALLAGARTVIVSNRSEERRAFARELGASVTVDPTSEDLSEVVAEHTHGLGVDVAVVCIGVASLVNDALGLARKGGRVNLFAGFAGEGVAEVEANLIHYNELVVSGASDTRRADYETALRLIESGRIEVESMVTHRFPLGEAAEAIEASARREGIKVAVVP
ncbi:alcohol dehydrogenase catalytic domain-containing protein [Rubrobacter marinus]|uniref:Alcohol dehydrogenase catalytic domain-containing protein n=1 Tax=Rubrobacter marinus TaxID=2653852 RepID=A0A6G8PT88_9ACTN|nr:alcohol dehydrogenase catalytic domain-containing protein [Rubrobacter marinus]QIN77417.1 alcohol dehydrogenase catalytic domain-containing protein [Rubrobacter marinus]